jgi:hypothetical protein
MFSGADLAALIREASEIAMTEHILQSLPTEDACVHQSHIDRAFSKIIPSVSEAVIIFHQLKFHHTCLFSRIVVDMKNFVNHVFVYNKFLIYMYFFFLFLCKQEKEEKK